MSHLLLELFRLNSVDRRCLNLDIRQYCMESILCHPDTNDSIVMTITDFWKKLLIVISKIYKTLSSIIVKILL